MPFTVTHCEVVYIGPVVVEDTKIGSFELIWLQMIISIMFYAYKYTNTKMLTQN